MMDIEAIVQPGASVLTPATPVSGKSGEESQRMAPLINLAKMLEQRRQMCG
jgi:hypothetical protein